MVTDADWRLWAANPDVIHRLPQYKPDLSFLPPLQRRRLGMAARLLFDAAWPLLDQAVCCPSVMVSHDGEINRSFDMWLALLGQNEVSPTAFGLSVHNALIGQWSMLRGDMSEGTALCVADEGLETALLEAYALLAEGAQQVLVLVVDEPLSKDYDVGAVRAPVAYALAMLVCPGDEWCLQRHAFFTEDALPVSPYWGALDWVRAQYAPQPVDAWVQSYRYGSWHWQRKIS